MMVHDESEFRDHYPQPEKWKLADLALRSIAVCVLVVVVAFIGTVII